MGRIEQSLDRRKDRTRTKAVTLAGSDREIGQVNQLARGREQ